MRARLGATLAVLAALGAVAAGSHAADAASPDTFTVVSAQAQPGSPDQLTVVVDSPSTITDLSAGFVAGNGTDVFDLALTPGATETDPADPTQTQSTWNATVPVGASGLALGSYQIKLDGTFSDSGTYSIANATWVPFNFFASSSVTLTAANDNLTSSDPWTTLSGQVTLTYPDGTPDTDYTDLTVDFFADNMPVGGDAFVQSDGTFSFQIEASASESVTADVPSNDWVASSAPSSPVLLSVAAAATTQTLTLTANSVSETYGKPATVTGTLTDTADGTPVAGQQVWVNTTDSPAGALAAATTSSTGAFTITLPERPAGGTLYVGSASADDQASAVPVPLTLKVVHPTVISSFKATLNQYWSLSVSGCLGFPAADKTEKITHTTGLTVEYELPGQSWKKLGSISGTEADHACGTGGIQFTGSFEAPENYADYRVVYAGTSGSTSFAATTGASALAWRYADRIIDLKVSPTTVNAGGKLSVSGVLQYYSSGWHNYSGQTIVIYLHPEGSNPTWYWLVKITTNAKGQFSASFKDPTSATWRAVFEGNNSNGAGHLSTGSSEIYVRLK